jgi:polar amino acid transport system permease protein
MPAEGFITTAACYLVLYYGLKGLAALSERWLGLLPARARA